MKKARKDTAIGAATKEPAGGFDPLRAVLEDISTAYTNLEVRSQPPDPSVTSAVRNQVENLLSRIARLEVLFAEPPGNVPEQSRRSELIWYAILPPIYILC